MSENQGTEWTKSQQIAYPYIENAINRGLSASQGLQEYRQGGGSIRDSLWYSLFRETYSYTAVPDKIEAIPGTYTIPETMYQPVDWDLRSKYAIRMEVVGYSHDIGANITKWVTVESDKLLTKNELIGLANTAIFDNPGSPLMEVNEILDYDLVMRNE
jgi:hypothetical protein